MHAFNHVFLILAAATLLAANDSRKTFPPKGYSLAWGDDFDGSTVDTGKWNFRTDVKMDSSQRPENVTVEGGNLVIHVKKESHRGKQYTGGGVVSKPAFRYGYYEARVKMHGGGGWHQSVWGAHGVGETTYPAGMRTEIDGMEYDSDRPDRGHMGLILWNGPGRSRSTTCSPGVYRGRLGFDATADFHVYGFEWREEDVRFYLDGELECVLPHPPSGQEHGSIGLWLTAIAAPAHAGKVDEAKLPGRMLIDHAYFYAKDVYVDDGDAAYSDTGVWSTAPGDGFAYSAVRRSCAGNSQAVWRPRLPAAGEYEVFFHRVPMQRHLGSSAEIEVAGIRKHIDFSEGPTGWVSLGKHRLAAGIASVRLTRQSGCAAADMVKFVKTL